MKRRLERSWSSQGIFPYSEDKPVNPGIARSPGKGFKAVTGRIGNGFGVMWSAGKKAYNSETGKKDRKIIKNGIRNAYDNLMK